MNKQIQKLMMIVVILLATTVNAFSYKAEKTINKTGQQFFIENKGQWSSDVLFLTRMNGLDVWITKYGVNYTFYQVNHKHAGNNIFEGEFGEVNHDNCTLKGHRVLFELQNYNPQPVALGKQKQDGYYNYLIGNDSSKYANHVGLYNEAIVKDVYPGIDLRYYFDKGYLRYDFIVHPGADPKQIQFTLNGSNKNYLKENTLCFTTRFGEVQMQDLTVYQGQKTIKAKFKKNKNIWQFDIDQYSHTQDLIIDPLIYSTYLGGNKDEYGNAISVDTSGNAYVAGETWSPDYDVTTGAFQTTFDGGSRDVFVTKLNDTGTGIIYATYLGGGSDDRAYGIAVDNSGNAYITGYTESTDFDITTGAFQTTHEGDYDVFVAKLNTTGTGLVYSTYLGGNGYDVGRGINVDSSGYVYITGNTNSTDYDTTTGAYQTIGDGSYKAFVTKINTSGTDLIYSTYIGGTGNDYGFSIDVDDSGNTYIAGYTNSLNYDITTGAYQSSYGGGYYDAFVTKLNATGTALIYSTYLGGNNTDQGLGIRVDNSGNAYLTGHTGSSNFSTTSGSYQTTYGGGFYDAFVTKLNATGTALIYSTFLGGSDTDESYGIDIDNSGNVYITGHTTSSDYDITTGAYQTTYGGGNRDIIVSKLNNTGNGLLYSTFLGGSSYENGKAICVDNYGYAYITGYTSSTDFDTTTGAYQTNNAGLNDAFVTKMPLCVQPTVTANASATTICAGESVTLTGSGASTYVWDNGVTDGVAFTPTTTTTYTVTGTNANGCSGTDQITITVNQVDTSVTNNDPTLMANATNATYQWVDCDDNFAAIPGETSASFTATANGSYAVIVTQNGCTEMSACYTISSLGINDLAETNNIRFYPNPTTDHFIIDLSKSYTNVRVNMTNALGQLVYKNKLKTAIKIPVDISEISRGVYFVQVYAKNKLIGIFKISKE